MDTTHSYEILVHPEVGDEFTLTVEAEDREAALEEAADLAAMRPNGSAGYELDDEAMEITGVSEPGTRLATDEDDEDDELTWWDLNEDYVMEQRAIDGER